MKIAFENGLKIVNVVGSNMNIEHILVCNFSYFMSQTKLFKVGLNTEFFLFSLKTKYDEK